MNTEQALSLIEPQVASMRLFDFHTHLVGGKLAARGLHDILLYHMGVSDLYPAGCPSGARLTQYPGWADKEEAHFRLKEAIPFFPRVVNTGIAWGNRIILADLYDWHQPVTLENWERLDAMIRERADDRTWHREIMRRALIERFVTETNRRGEGLDDDILDYSVEWAFFTRAQWGEFDTALYELEKTWGEPATGPSPIGMENRPKTKKTIQKAADVYDAVHWFMDQFPMKQTVSYATHISSDLDYTLVSEAEFEAALKRRDQAGEKERSIYASYVNEVFLTEYAKKFGPSLAFQYTVCADPLPFETGSRISQRTLGQIADMMARHPKIRFTVLESSAHANQTFCTFCRELQNVALCGIWWHNFFPAIMPRIMAERLDMVSLNKQIGFFSDAYCVEWAYAKAVMIKKVLSRVLAEKVELGQYDVELAVHIAKTILYDSSKAWNNNTEMPF